MRITRGGLHVCRKAIIVVRQWDEYAEVSRGHSKPDVFYRDEGLNIKLRQRDLTFDGAKDAANRR